MLLAKNTWKKKKGAKKKQGRVKREEAGSK